MKNKNSLKALYLLGLSCFFIVYLDHVLQIRDKLKIILTDARIYININKQKIYKCLYEIY